MLERILICRHGHRANWDSAFYPHPTGIPADPALALHGVNQSKELSRHLSSLEYQIDRVYSSPFYRCVQTIYPFVEEHDMEIYVDNGIGFGRSPSPKRSETREG